MALLCQQFGLIYRQMEFDSSHTSHVFDFSFFVIESSFVNDYVDLFYVSISFLFFYCYIANDLVVLLCSFVKQRQLLNFLPYCRWLGLL